MKAFIDRHVKWVFSLPAFVFMALMMVAPIFATLAISTTNWSMTVSSEVSFIGFQNYIDLLKNPDFWRSILTTFHLVFLELIGEITLGVIIALLLNRNFKGKTVVKIIVLLPFVCAPLAIATVWNILLEPSSGIINYYLYKWIGVRSTWLAAESTAIPSIALIDVWQATPLVVLICLAGLAAMPSEPYESALVDGASKFQVLRYITLPLLAPTILTAALLRFIDAFKAFDLIFALTGGGPNNATQTINMMGYKQAFQNFRFGQSSAILVLLFLLVLSISRLIIAVQRKVQTQR
ncbi:MAG: sugar ABC transporter permease [Clostridiales bacterium]|jgi:multiple sugar transport system permease protein|nr:sugar ABC transporter permease [Clostridiales bacterium]